MPHSIFYSVVLGLGGLFAPQALLACSVCYQALPQGLMAYYGTTLILGLLPLALILGLACWFKAMAART